MQSQHEAPSTLFHSSSRLWRVRLVQYASLIGLVVATWAAWGIFRTYGLNPADGYGGVLAPLSHRATFAGIVLTLGVLFAGGMGVYGRCYVVRMDLDKQRQCLTLHLAGFLRRTTCEIPLADLNAAGRHNHLPQPFRSLIGPSQVDAPWISISVKGRRLPLILDRQADFPEARTFEALVKKLEQQASKADR